MNFNLKENKKSYLIILAVVFILIGIFATIFILINKDEIKVYMQEEKPIEEIQTTSNNDLLGTITIEKIGLKNAPTHEGTSSDILKEYIGHFEETSWINGNVAFCSHNRGYENGSYFERLNELEIGDKITYTNITGTHIYTVDKINEIKETDLSVLENTAEDRITLITCIANKREYRLCVSGTIEK